MKIFAATFCLFFPLINTCAQSNIVTATNEFRVTGAVKKELKLTLQGLLQFRQDSLGDIIIRNKKGEIKDTSTGLKGVLLKTILDSAGITAEKPKEYSELCIILTASDGYVNVYSWNELFNNDAGNHVYVITTMNGKTTNEMNDRILVLNPSDINSGRRHLKGLTKIEIKKVK